MHRELYAVLRPQRALVGIVLALAVAGCGSADVASTASSGRAASGGTAYFAEQPQSPPNYIFPLVSGEYYSVENVNNFQTLMYRPLYWYGDQDRPGVDYKLSLGDKPAYSDDNTVVTITLKHARWSDGEAVSARDVGFWINLLKANRGDWASYVPGGFPDNVASWTAVGRRTIRLKLNASYNPIWFTDNELSQITPLPLAWDRSSRSQPVRGAAASNLPDTTTTGAKAVYDFLNGQARSTAGYATSPLWQVVDGAWKLQSLTAQGEATFVPNRRYDGPNRPRLAKLVELPFTSETAEFSVLRAGSAAGGPASSGSEQISVGWVPDTDIPQAPTLRGQGYRLVDFYPYGFDYFEPNFNNPTVGPILRQLYFRQAFQHLVNQSGWISAYYGGLGVPTYSPVPAQPANPYTDASAKLNPYPFSVTDSRAILAAHGWKVVPNGVTTCDRPGTAADECGPGIPAGKQLKFTLMYPSGFSYTDGAMTDLQSVASEVGVQIALKEVTTATIDATIEPCSSGSAACGWELGQYAQAWVFAPDHYPTGEEIFQRGALGNVNNYADPEADRLIKQTTTTSAAGAQKALNAYANYLREQLPDFWQPSPGTMLSVQSNLAGVVPNAYGFISPEEWYFTK